MLSFAVLARTPVTSSMSPILIGWPAAAALAAGLAAALALRAGWPLALALAAGLALALAAGLDAATLGGAAELAGGDVPPQPTRKMISPAARYVSLFTARLLLFLLRHHCYGMDLQLEPRIRRHADDFHGGAGRPVLAEVLSEDAVDGVLVFGHVADVAGHHHHVLERAAGRGEHGFQVLHGKARLFGRILRDAVEIPRDVRVLVIDRRGGHARHEHGLAGMDLDSRRVGHVEAGIALRGMDWLDAASHRPIEYTRCQISNQGDQNAPLLRIYCRRRLA